jgi:hypothetical protein
MHKDALNLTRMRSLSNVYEREVKEGSNMSYKLAKCEETSLMAK